MSIAQAILDSIQSDDEAIENIDSQLVSIIEDTSEKEKQVLSKFTIALCGYSIESLLELANEKCSVCGVKLTQDDEAYSDEITQEILCDSHALINEHSGNYVSSEAQYEIIDDEKRIHSGIYKDMLVAFYTIIAGFGETFDVEQLAGESFESLKVKWVVPVVGEIKLIRVQ